MMPGIRTLISVPAGMVEIPRHVFYVWTALGSAIWLTFLAVNSAQAVSEVLFEPVYMPVLRKYLPELPVWRPHWVISLLGSTTLLLFLPKFLGALPILLQDFKWYTSF